MSSPKRYNLRGTATPGAREEREASPSSSESGDFQESVNKTIMAEEATQQHVAADQVSAILASLNALRASVEELRLNGVESQRDIDRLRTEIHAQQPTVAVSQLQQPQPTITDAMSTPTATPSTTRHVMIPERIPNVSLYDLPTFSGNTEEWPLFIANFNDTTAAFGYSDRQNLMRLQKCLFGAARQAVASMLIYPNNVSQAIEELEFRFGRPDLLVRVQLTKIQEFPFIHENKLEQMVDFSTKVRNVVAFLTSAGCQQHLANPALLEQLVLKLPHTKQFEWARHAANIRPYPTLREFCSWISDLARIVCLMPTTNVGSDRRKNASLQSTRRVTHISESVPKKEIKCAHCEESHFIDKCKIFLNSLNVRERWSRVKELQLCFSCLRRGHSTANCQNKKMCNINECRRHHHACLHEDPPLRAAITSNKVQPVLNCRTASSSSELFKILPVTLYGPLGKEIVYCMFDDGSAISILEEDVANRLGLKGKMQALTLQWYGQNQITEQSFKVNLEIEGADKSNKFTIKNVRTVRNLGLPVQSFFKANFEHLNLLPLVDYTNAKPTLLLGLDNVHLGISSTIVEAGCTMPVAAKTKLGWVAFGPIKQPTTTYSPFLHVREGRTLNDLHNVVAEYFLAEHFGTTTTASKMESDEDKQARQVLEATTKRIDKGFETGLLWKKYPPTLPSSYEMAEKRLLSIERKMRRDPKFGEWYRIEMNKYFERGYARKVIVSSELNSTEHPIWYLPHFGVQNPHKPEKLRIVFDAAAVVSRTSLNSELLRGPEQVKSLLSILFQFRQGAVGVAADIREMFSQIKIRQVDQHAQRFLWRNGDSTQPIQHHATTSLIFGAICSPCCAEFIKNRNAEEFREQFPEAAAAVIGNHYVDDFVCSFRNEMEAEKLCKEVVHINNAGGFELRDFISNSKVVQAALNNVTGKAADAVDMECQKTTEKILGMFWNTMDDTFIFKTQFHRVPKEVQDASRVPTKRELLGIAMAIFDPYGLLADFLIFSKVLMQDTWKCKIDWDTAIPLELHKKWIAWWREFKNVKYFRIARCYSPYMLTSDDIQLHLFVGASQIAFAAVAYFRVAHSHGVDVAFVAGKTRNAPQKLLSVPRLELQAAVLGTRLSRTILNNHSIKISSVIFWSDSQTVLQWINSSNRKYKPFVGHRIAEILDSTNPVQWRWVPSRENSADVATRPVSPPKFQINSRWVMGPNFLKDSEPNWPIKPAVLPPDFLEEELKPCLLVQSEASNQIIQFNNFSSFVRLKRTVAWVLRAKTLWHKAKSVVNLVQTPLTAAEIGDAEKLICQMVQAQCFAEEIVCLKTAKPVPKRSSIYALSPYYDEDGLVRVNGRIDEATFLPYNTRRPILLPQKHKVSELIMRYFHEKGHHQNSSVQINEVRQRFWIPHVKALLKNVQQSCLHCKIKKSKPATPQMGQMPIDRVTPFVRPFSYTGVDFFGPLNVSIGRRHEKRWVAIYTCLTTRAVHLELAQNLSTDAFIITFRNFVNRRGTPVRMRSDNGTNFIGAQKELKQNEHLLDLYRLTVEATNRGIDWQFNCPANPSSGGCWERLIRIVKLLLKETLRDIAPRLETLQSVLIEAENILNSRPLTDLPISSQEEEPLTPNHFLMGCVNSTQTPHPVDLKICLRKQWRIAQNLKDRLWKRWVNEYLPQLIHRPKWHEKTIPIKIDDLVIICDNNQPRSQWPKGRITQVFPAKDGQIRFAEVKTSNGLLRRPTSKLAILAIDGESQTNSRREEC